MAIVAYGYGLDTSLAGAVPSEGTFLIELLAEPEIELSPDIDIVVEPDINIVVEPDIDIEVE